MGQARGNNSDYLDPAVDVETATLGLPAPRWMGLDELGVDTSVVCVAERVLSGDCNDGIDHVLLVDLLRAMLPEGVRLHAWLYSDKAYRKLLVDKLDMSTVAGFAPFDVMTAKHGEQTVHSLRRVTEIHPDPSRSQLLGVIVGILAFTLSDGELQEIGLPNSVLTFAGWGDDRMAMMPRGTGGDGLLTSFPSWDDLVDAYDISILPAGDHGSDCIIASKCLSRSALVDMVHAAMDKLQWHWAFRGHIEGNGYEQMYQRSMAEERHPGHSRTNLDLE